MEAVSDPLAMKMRVRPKVEDQKQRQIDDQQQGVDQAIECRQYHHDGDLLPKGRPAKDLSYVSGKGVRLPLLAAQIGLLGDDILRLGGVDHPKGDERPAQILNERGGQQPVVRAKNGTAKRTQKNEMAKPHDDAAHQIGKQIRGKRASEFHSEISFFSRRMIDPRGYHE